MSDFDIFLVPSRRLMTRVASPKIMRLGQREELALVTAVEGAGDVARELKVLGLVVTDGHYAAL